MPRTPRREHALVRKEENVMLRTVLAALAVSFLISAVSGTEVISAQAAGAQARPRAAETCTAEEGQLLIDAGSYDRAIREFTCLIDAQPTEVEGYRGRIEAELLSGLYSDAVRDYARVTAYVLPVHPDAQSTILNGYAARLSASPD